MNIYDDSAPSPASSISHMSCGSDPSPSPSPSLTSSSCPYSPDASYRYKYEEYYNTNLTANSAPLRPLPAPTHRSEYNQQLQQKFDLFVDQKNKRGLEELLASSS